MTIAPERSRTAGREPDVRRALDGVADPELDEPITDLGFVRSVAVADDGTVEVHLRLPTSFCSPSFAYLMAGDAKDAVSALPWVTRAVVQLDDHHDSELINRGLAADAGYLGTFGDEAESDLDGLRETFRRKAHTAAMERSLTGLLRADPDLAETALGAVTLADLPAGDRFTAALLQRRAALGRPPDPSSLVPAAPPGQGYPPHEVPLRLRRARSTRISIDGNAHFCRGLLRTRYGETDVKTFIPLNTLMTKEGAIR
jgi:metal-sulfur cluster biosynthetic enzyme